ncbi:hypothetical protein [Defluviimonas sp. SAOS-178_SWC]|uniref:hypothetical protein n=1 Tax=Defluviimonas sp. SAOS-178_SWC TaxID=3121287 RepID=UPI003221749F
MQDMAHAETNRGRIRRILLDPLGFRFPKKVEPEEAQRRLDRIADDLGYLADASLKALEEMLRSKGQGSDRNFWPDHATFIGFAEVIQPRPLDELPALRSWFGSVEGPRAIAEGTLVETYGWIARRKVPPYTPQARALVLEEAAQNARRLSIIAERKAAGLSVATDDLDWERAYRRRMADCQALVERERTLRGKETVE